VAASTSGGCGTGGIAEKLKYLTEEYDEIAEQLGRVPISPAQ
jgi:hypothetical protein